MDLSPHLGVILTACLLDALLGDPVYRLHPVRLLGALSLAGERALFVLGLNGRLGGMVHWVLVVGGALLAWWAVRQGLQSLPARWGTGLALGWDTFIAYSLLCMRDLLAHGLRVFKALDDLPEARRRLGMLVGRDTEHLDRGGIVRATIESLSENLTDGVLTPLWALCLWGLPGLIVVKAVSTLDSMVGYRTERYRRFGWVGARSDDLVHWLPARLSVPLIALAATLLRLHPWLALRAAWRDHGRLPSPNSGWSEAATAGALRVRLVGPIRYRGAWRDYAFMGEPDWPVDLDAGHLRRALGLILTCSVLGLAVGVGLAWLRVQGAG
jgi:adenosylcobinamide-phosphate synthase